MSTALKNTKKKKTAALFILALGACFTLWVLYRYKAPEPVNTQTPLEASAAIPNAPALLPSFSLINYDGNTVTEHDVAGKWWVANFIFTRCDMTCPLMTGLMASVQDAFRGRSDIRFVSFSVDPDYDTPGRLGVYAEKFMAEHGQWFFLTGSKETIYNLAGNFFLLSASEITAEDRASGAEAFLHSDRFALVDPNGRIVKYYRGTENGAMVSIVNDLNQLTKNTAAKTAL